MSPPQLSIIFDVTITTIHERLKKLNFNTKHDEAIRKKTRNKRQDYERTFRSGKIARLNDQIRKSSVGTRNENYARSLLAYIIYEYFRSDFFDIVVGVNNTGILGSMEVDIPVMIHDKINNKLHKFVVEYNAEIFHSDDTYKITTSKKKGWEYIPIVEKKNSKATNDPKYIEKQIRMICEEIFQITQRSD